MPEKLLSFLHNPVYKNGSKSNARIALARTDQGWQERLYRFHNFLDACDHLPPELEDVYFSLNGFGKHRRLDCIVQINSLFVDLDIYGLFQDPDFVLDTVKQMIPDSIPKPGIVSYSGRGLWLIWPIDPLPKAALFRWMELQNHFVRSLQHLGADPKVKDVTRVIRLPNSLNSKSQSKVRFEIWHEERYAFHKLEKLYLPPKKASTKKAKSKPRTETQVNPKFFTPYSLNIAIIEDLQRLADLRGRQLTGHREYFLFIWRNCLAQLGTSPAESERQVRSVALQYLGSERLPDREWTRSTMSPYRASFEHEDGSISQGYRLTKDWIISNLGITPKEQKQMQFLIETQEKYRRKNEKRRPQRAKQTRAEYLETVQDRYSYIRLLKAEYPNATYQEIANLAKVSRRTVFNALKK